VHYADPEAFLTPAEVQARLRITVKTLYRLIGEGRLPAVRIGRQWRVRPSDLDMWLRRHQSRAGFGPESARGTPGDASGVQPACPPDGIVGNLPQGEKV
jgi:excisionase family DNA binding protein